MSDARLAALRDRPSAVRAVIRQDEEVEAEDAAVLTEGRRGTADDAVWRGRCSASSSRLMRIITGAFAFFESSAGIDIEIAQRPCCRSRRRNRR
jgi:hypothetical protein